MILINFSHPLTDEQRTELEQITNQQITQLIERMAHFDVHQPFAPQATALVDEVGLTPAEWQSAPLLLIPPALNFAAAAVIAEITGRRGHFPNIVRIRPVENSIPQRYEVAEVVNLQKMRDEARKRRG